MNWLSKLLEHLPIGLKISVDIKAGGQRHEIVRIFRIEPSSLEVCVPEIHTKHRRWPFSDQLHKIHLLHDGHIDWQIQ